MNSDLSAEKLKSLLIYEEASGLFIWRVSRGRQAAGKNAGVCRPDGYVAIRIEGRIYLAHRLAWLYVHGVWPECFIDHINGNPNDNRISNLRDVQGFVNSQNLKKAHSRNKTCGLLGASFHKASNKWLAQISFHGKVRAIGFFESANDAHQAYLKAKREMHEGCTI